MSKYSFTPSYKQELAKAEERAKIADQLGDQVYPLALDKLVDMMPTDKDKAGMQGYIQDALDAAVDELVDERVNKAKKRAQRRKAQKAKAEIDAAKGGTNGTVNGGYNG